MENMWTYLASYFYTHKYIIIYAYRQLMHNLAPESSEFQNSFKKNFITRQQPHCFARVLYYMIFYLNEMRLTIAFEAQQFDKNKLFNSFLKNA